MINPITRGMPLLLGLSLTACAAVPDSWLAADRATFDALANEYATYVKADVALSEAEKAERLLTLDSWELRLRAEELDEIRLAEASRVKEASHAERK